VPATSRRARPFTISLLVLACAGAIVVGIELVEPNSASSNTEIA